MSLPNISLTLPHVAVASDPASMIPLVIDSPHSGRAFPAEGRCVAPVEALLASWDAYVDELWSGTSDVGGCLVAATFHRAFIDLNRDELDIESELLAEPWSDTRPTALYAARGKGLIRRLALPNVPMYDRLLSVAEVKQRIERYYQPYNQALSAAIEAAYARFGTTWHINCHSMKSRGNAMNTDNGESRPDLVISDRVGTTADPEFTRWVAECWSKLGYRVTTNHPYQGGDIVRRYGAPARGRHSIQIEINRRLYMNEQTFERHEGFARLEHDVRLFLARLRRRINDALQQRAPSGRLHADH